MKVEYLMELIALSAIIRIGISFLKIHRRIKDIEIKLHDVRTRVYQRIGRLEENSVGKTEFMSTMGPVQLKLESVYDWESHTLRGYCYKLIEVEEKGSAHVLVVFANGYRNDTLDTKHVECILSNSSDIYNKIKAEGHPITFHESTDYLKQGYVWVPAYKAYKDWPGLESVEDLEK